ncbi:MAG: hypothetical protein AB9836_09315 [Aminipila sp.]
MNHIPINTIILMAIISAFIMVIIKVKSKTKDFYRISTSNILIIALICIFLCGIDIYQKNVIDDLYNQKSKEIHQFMYNVQGENENWKIEDAYIFNDNYSSYIDGGVIKYKGKISKIDKLSVIIMANHIDIFSTTIDYGIWGYSLKERESLGQQSYESDIYEKNTALENRKIYAVVEYSINGELKKEKFRLEGQYHTIPQK